MRSVLFVCTANLCRSPVAAAMFRESLQRAGLKEVCQVSSAGTWGEEGLPAVPNAVAVMLERGLDLRQHRSRIVTHELLAEQDLILVMEDGHKEALQVEFPEAAGRIHVLSNYAGSHGWILDPHSPDLGPYRVMVDELGSLVNRVAKRILGDGAGARAD